MERIEEFLNEKSRICFFSSVVLMVVAHGFCFLNIMYSHDSVFFSSINGGNKVELGRWFYPIVSGVRFVATPWIMGILSIIYVSFSAVLVAKIFDFTKIQGICVALIFSTNITLISLFCSYIFDADTDCLALLLACFSVYAFKFLPPKINIIVSVISLTLCLGLYQTYICVAIGLFLMSLIYDSKEARSRSDVHNLLKKGLKELAIIIAASVLYLVIMRASAGIYGTTLSGGYNGPERLGSLTWDEVLRAIPKAYVYCIGTFFKITEYNTWIIAILNGVVLILVFWTLIHYIKTLKGFYGGLLVIIPGLLILPLALNAIYIVSMGTIHQLMIFSFSLLYFLPMVFTNMSIQPEEDTKKTKVGPQAIIIVIIVLIGLHNIVYSNGAYTYRKLVYDNTLLHAQTIWKDINNLDGYDEENTEVVFIGDVNRSKMAYSSIVDSRYLNTLTGATNSAISSDEYMSAYYYSILGRNIKISPDKASVQETDEVKEMPAYPKDGYCKMIGDRVIVKLE